MRIFVNSLKKYLEVKKVFSNSDKITDSYGNEFILSDYLLKQEEKIIDEIIEKQRLSYIKYYKNPENVAKALSIDKNWKPNIEHAISIPATTELPTYISVWLIRNCDNPVIVQNLKQHYGDRFYKIKNYNSEFDDPQYIRSKRFKIKINPEEFEKFGKIKNKNIIWIFSIVDSETGPCLSMSFNREKRMWFEYRECKKTDSAIYKTTGNLSRRRLKRIIGRWNLPINVTLSVIGQLQRENNKFFTVVNRFRVRIIK